LILIPAPAGLGILSTVVVFWVFWHFENERWFKGLRRERGGECICDFARSCDPRQHDPWVIRAVYEHFATSFPIRASDTLESLRFDEEEVGFAVVALAERTKRDLVGREDWPLPTWTVGQLVTYLSSLPGGPSSVSGTASAVIG
jgi:hypothetical protein